MFVTEVYTAADRPERRMVAELLDQWHEHMSSSGRSVTTLREYRRLIENRLEPRFGASPLECSPAGTSPGVLRWSSMSHSASSAFIPPTGCATGGTSLRHLQLPYHVREVSALTQSRSASPQLADDLLRRVPPASNPCDCLRHPVQESSSTSRVRRWL